MFDALRKIANPKGLTPLLTPGDRDRFYWSALWISKRLEIKDRDNHECQVCKSEGRVTLTDLIVHHIKPLEFYPDVKLDDDNLITVCQACHNRIHFETEVEWDDEWW